MAKSKSQLGIVDWGIGGVGIYSQIKSRLGSISVTYFSDTGATPYGKMSRAELTSRLNVVVAFLRSQGVTHLVVGCNAASTVLPLLDLDQIKVEGVIASAVHLTATMHPARLGLIGGRRTVQSGVYRRALHERGISVRQRIAQPLSARIENGDVTSSVLRSQCQAILAPLRSCSHVLLACTHYPAIIPVLKDFVSSETVFIDPAAEIANRVSRWRLPKGGEDRFFTSGEPEKMRIAASNAFGVKIRTIKKVTL